MNKGYILSQIKQTTEENNGKPLGMGQFQKRTGIRRDDWYGKFWTKWSDAVAEAGYTPNTLQVPYDKDWLLEQLALFTRELGRFPTKGDLKMKNYNHKEFPTSTTFEKRFGSKVERARKLVEYCEKHVGFEDVKNAAMEVGKTDAEAENQETKKEGLKSGFVYLMKSGKFYKIGRSNSPGRRNYELDIKLPEQVSSVHTISTDDPVGIEAYWHKRFEQKRTRGEWFNLNSEDVKAFKRRKFM